ncbi:MAG: PP2C family protein-serine/threonine phosphatase [Planctomycetota bacterium]
MRHQAEALTVEGIAIDRACVFTSGELVTEETRRFCGGLLNLYSVRSPDKVSANEDGAALLPFSPTAGVLAIADGVGGLPSGERASALALNALQRSLEEGAAAGLRLREAILNGFEAANRAVNSETSGAATTLAAVAIQDGLVRPYHVGDCEVVVTGQRGKIKLQTVSHSPVGYAVESGLLDEHEAMHHEERHIVSNLIGCPGMRIEIGPAIGLARHDTLILGSDGLFDNLRTEEIVETVRKGPLAAASASLARDCRRRMEQESEHHPSKPDDLTFILYRLDLHKSPTD